SYLCLAAQKNYYVLHAMCVYCDPKREAWLKSEFKKAGKRLDMGKACIRFKKLEDLPLDVIAQVVAAATPEEYIARYEAGRKESCLAPPDPFLSFFAFLASYSLTYLAGLGLNSSRQPLQHTKYFSPL